MPERDDFIEYLHRYWAQQKAVGMIAEARFLNNFESTNIDTVSEVMLFQPKAENDEFQPWENIYTFILDAAERDTLTQTEIRAGYLMEQAGTTVIFPQIKEPEQSGLESFRVEVDDRNVENEYSWKWRRYDRKNRCFEEIDIDDETSAWRTGGYATTDSSDYLEELTDSLSGLPDDTIREMFYKQHFFSNNLKDVHSFTGTYFDIDGLLVDDETIVPYEIKEKSVYTDGPAEMFGLDVSRLIVMLRVGLTEALDPIYVVREVEEAEMHGFDRDFVDWHVINSSDVVRVSAWQVQGGGPGMTGGRTMTLMIPKTEFESPDFDSLNLNEYTDFVGHFQSGIE